MAKRPLKNDIPAKTAPKSGVFNRQGRVNGANPYPSNRRATVGNGGSITTNRQKPGGGHGSAGETTSVKDF